MRRLIVALMCFCLMFNMYGCKNHVDNNISGNLSITRYSDATGKYYEETSNGYKAAFYEKSEINAEKIVSWLSSCNQSEGYNQYIYSDPDSWDMFIYYYPKNGIIGGNSFKFAIDGATVKVYVTSDSSIKAASDYILIGIQAPLRGSWPNLSELYLDNVKIQMQNGDYQ